jgi:ABC-2 type transport system ATP-binding protein
MPPQRRRPADPVALHSSQGTTAQSSHRTHRPGGRPHEYPCGRAGGVSRHRGNLRTGLHKRFGKVQALVHVDLDVRPHEIVTLLGPNGAGKSTLLRILSTVTLPDGGVARIGGVDVAADPAAVRRQLGVSFGEDRAWYWRLTGRQNLEFFATLYGLRRRAAGDRIDELLETFSLTEAADRRFDGYSSGMKARFSLMRALIPSPRVLLLDEPTRSLDPIAAADFRRTVLELRDQERIAILLTTHDLHEAAELADRITILVKGRIVATVDGDRTAAQLQQLLIETVMEWA